MAVIALMSAKGSPGVSVSALALSLSWQRDTILAECDPAGGDVLPGFLAGQMAADRGIGELSGLNGRGRLETEFWGQLVDLDAPHRRRLLLPGVARLADSGGMATIAETLAGLFAGLGHAERPYDVVADCGPLNAVNTLWPLLPRADALVLVVRGTLPSIAHARATLADLRERYTHIPGGLDALRLLVIDEGRHVHEAPDTLGVPLLGVLPHDPRSARELSLGGTRIKAHHRLVRACRTDEAPDLVDYAVVRQLHRDVHDELTTLLREQGEVTAEYRRAEGERITTQRVNRWVDAQRRSRNVTDAEEDALLDAVLAEVVGLGRLQPLLDDPTIENITILGYDQVRLEYRDGGGIGYGKPVADSDEHLIRLVQNLARQGTAIGTTERSLSPSKPMLDMQLPDGSRLTVAYQVSQRPVVVIRRHGAVDVTLDDLVGPKYNMIDPVLARFLEAAVASDANIMIAGKGGSGKTTLLRALGSCIPSNEWFVVMEESRELGFHLTGRHPWCVSLEAREGHGGLGPDGRPVGELRLGTMFPITQRLNTQRVIVGEVRDEEIIAALQAMSTTGGSFCTIHARHVDLVFDRVVELALAHRNENSVERAYRQVAGAIDYIVYVQLADESKIGGSKHRFVSHVLELNGVTDGQVKYTTVFGPDASGRAVPRHLTERHREDLLQVGYDLGDLNRHAGQGLWPRPLNRLARR